MSTLPASEPRAVTPCPAPPAAPPCDVRIRPVRPDDAVALRAFYAGLSDESRRSRFFMSSAGISDEQATYFCTADHREREGFVAIAGPGMAGTGGIVGHACVETVRAGVAEFAVAVGDAVQGRGIGRQLLRSAIGWAQDRGFRQLVATMLPGNPGIHRLARSLGLPTRFRMTSEGLTAAELDLVAAHHEAAPPLAA